MKEALAAIDEIPYGHEAEDCAAMKQAMAAIDATP